MHLSGVSWPQGVVRFAQLHVSLKWMIVLVENKMIGRTVHSLPGPYSGYLLWSCGPQQILT